MCFRVFFTAFILLIMLNKAHAQTVPSTVEPGALDNQFNEKKEFTPPDEIDLPKATPKRTAPADAKNIKFVPSNVIIEGNTVYSDSKLKSFYGDLIGKEVSLSDVFAAAGKITDLYQNDGYLLSFAVVPAQRIKKDGVVKITVVEGFIDEVSFLGTIKWRDGLFKKWAKTIESQKPINKNTLEKIILLAGGLPGVSVETYIEASKNTPNASNLNFKVNHDYIDGSVAVNNYGSRYAGPFQAEAVLATNSALGLYERIQFRSIDTLKERESQYREASVSTLLNALGTSANILVSQGKSYPGYLLKNAGIQSVSQKIRVDLSHPIILTRKVNLAVNGSLEAYHSEVETLGVQTSEDDLRIMRLGVNYSNLGNDGSYYFAALQASQGFELFGAKDSNSANLSRANGQSDFSKVTLNGGYNYMLTNKIGALITAKGQWAGTQLLSSEEFYFGGRQFGRGYDSSELVGDHGIAGAIELAYYGWVNKGPFKTYKLYSFVDAGAVWKIDSNQVDDRKTASSAGVGLKVDFAKGVTLNLEGNRPLTRDAAFRSRKDEEDGNFLVNLSVSF